MYFNEDNYDYDKLIFDIENLKIFENLSIQIIGKSVLSKNIFSLKLGCGEKHIIYIGTHHALEWISSSLLMKFAYNLLLCYPSIVQI